MRRRKCGRKGLLEFVVVTLLAISLTYSFQKPVVSHAAGLALDGSASSFRFNTSSLSVYLTTTNANDVIIVAVVYPPTTIITSVTSLGLPCFVLRASETYPNTVGLFTYYTIAPSPLSMANITVTMSGINSGFTIIAFGISGADANAPFDLNPGLPGINSGSSWTGASPSVTTSTSNSQDFIIGFLSTSDAPSATITPGFTAISNQGSQVVEYRIVSSPQTNLVENYTLSNNELWITIADAVQATSSSSSTVPFCITLNYDSGSLPLFNSQTSSPNYFTISYKSGGIPQTAYENYGTFMIHVDPTTAVTVPAISSASSSSEKWCTAIQSGTCLPTNFASPGLGSFASITLYYFDLIFQGALYSVSNGGSPAAPILTYFTAPSFSGPSDNRANASLDLTTSTQNFWALRSTTWSVSPNPLTGSSPTERWYSNSALSGTIPYTSIISPTYYRQYYNTFTASVANDGKPLNFTNHVTLTYSSFAAGITSGNIYSGLTWSGWTDANTPVTYGSTSSSSSTANKWSCSSGCVVTPTSGGNTFTATYIEQSSSTPSTRLSDLSLPISFAIVAAVVLAALVLIRKRRG